MGQLLRAPRWGQRARPNAQGPVDRHRSRGEAGRALEDGDAAQAGGCGGNVHQSTFQNSYLVVNVVTFFIVRETEVGSKAFLPTK